MTTRPRTLLNVCCLACFGLATLALAAGQQRSRGASRLFPIEKNGKWGFIDGTGATVFSVPFDTASPFSGGLASVMRYQLGDPLTGYVDKTGKIVWESSK